MGMRAAAHCGVVLILAAVFTSTHHLLTPCRATSTGGAAAQQVQQQHAGPTGPTGPTASGSAVAAAAAPAAPAAPAAADAPRPRCSGAPLPAGVRQQVDAAVAAANPAAARSMEVAAANPASPARLRINMHVHVVAASAVASARLVPPAALEQQLALLNSTYGPLGIDFLLKQPVNRVNKAAWSNVTKGTANERAMRAQLRAGGPADLNLFLLHPADHALGWSNFPWEFSAAEPWRDGVVIHAAALPGGGYRPYNRGYTMVHEVGHWLGLLHVFEGGCSPPGDGVPDTPPQSGPAYGCPLGGTDSCPGAPGSDPLDNPMGYADDACMRRFTPGQGQRIRDVWGAGFRGGRGPQAPAAPAARAAAAVAAPAGPLISAAPAAPTAMPTITAAAASASAAAAGGSGPAPTAPRQAVSMPFAAGVSSSNIVLPGQLQFGFSPAAPVPAAALPGQPAASWGGAAAAFQRLDAMLATARTASPGSDPAPAAGSSGRQAAAAAAAAAAA